MQLSLKQKEFWNNSTARWNIKSGATRSGKTYLDYYIIPKRIRATKNNGLLVLLGNTRGTLERNILDPMRDIWGPGLVGNISSDNTVKLFGKKVYALGADKKNSVARIQGAGIEYCYGDEVTTWSEEVFQMLKSRLDKPNSVFDGTCNPDNPNHWFKAFLDSDADIYHQHYTIDDNPFLDPFFVEQLKKEYAGSVYYQRFILGQWARAEGLVYDMFYEDKNVVKTIDRPYTDYYVAVDYGTQNATVFGLFGMYRGKWYLIKEYYYSGREKGRQKTDSQYADDLQAFIDGIPIMHVIIDPSAASFKAELRQRGIPARDANNDVLNGIRYTGGLLSNERLLINDCCTKTIDEFYTYSWDDKASLLGEDKPLKEDDHCLTEDTIVNTVDGDFKIKDLAGKTGMVYCYDEENQKPTTSKFYDVRLTREKADVFEIELEDGRTIQATEDHPILTQDGWKLLKNLSNTDYIIDIHG